MLENNKNDMRYTIDLFVYEQGYNEFLKVEKTLKNFQHYAEEYTELKKALGIKSDLSHVKTNHGIFNIINLRLDGDDVDLPVVYFETFPSDAEYIFVDPV